MSKQKVETLHIGEVDGKRWTLPADVQAQTIAVLGIRGSGKSHTASVIVEGVLDLSRQVVVIDPTDVWWGLKSSADGKRPGFPIVVLGGPHGDVPLNAGDGAAIADFVVDHQVSAVMSLRHMRKAEQRRFVTDFAEQLYHRKGESAHRTPLQVVIDECDAFVPQRVGGADARMVGAIEDLVRRGRAAGLGVCLISQRAASINKDVLTQIELLVAHRHTSPQDRKALQLWVEAHDTADRQATFMASLASLSRGHAWFWSPGWLDVFDLVAVRGRTTFDSSSTPSGGDTAAAPTKTADVDLDALRDALKQTIEQAEANDPKVLRVRLAQLERELAQQRDAAQAVPDQRAIEQRVQQAVDTAIAQRDVAWQKQVGEWVEDRLHEIGAQVNSAAKGVSLAMASLEHDQPAPVRLSPVSATHRTDRPKTQPITRPAAVRESAPVVTGRTDSLSKAERSILTSLAWWASLGVDDPGRYRVALIAGYHPKTKGFTNALGSLRTAGLIDGDRLTAQGIAIAEPPGKPPTLDGVHAMLRAQLKGAEVKIFDELISVGGRYRRDHLAEQLEYHPKTKGFTNALGRLRSLGLIDYAAGDIVATDLMYPAGL